MTCDDLLAASGTSVVHDDETVRELSVRVLDREVALMLGHRGLDDLARHLEELGVELADHHGRPLNEVHDLGERLGRNDRTHAVCALERLDALADRLGAALVVVDEHPALGSGVVVVRGRYGHCAFLGGYEEAMALRVASSGQVSELDGHHLVAVKREQPAHRAYEARIPAAPALRLGPRKTLGQTREQSGEHLCGGATGLLDDGVDVLAARFRVAHELADVDPLAARESFRGLRGVALGVERGRDRGSARAKRLVLLALGQSRHAQDDPPRSPVRLDALIAQPGGVEGLLGLDLELRDRFVQRRARDLLGTDLEKQVAAHRASPPSACESRSTYASQHALASVRTRRMKLTRSVTAMAPRASSRLNA